MDADNYFKVFKAWGLLLILCLLKFSSFFISVDSQSAFFSLEVLDYRRIRFRSIKLKQALLYSHLITNLIFIEYVLAR